MSEIAPPTDNHDNEWGSVHGLSGHLWYPLCYPKRHRHSLQLL